MNILGVILRYYLLALMLMPCTDMPITGHESEHTVAQWLNNHEHQHAGHAHDSEGDCSPLCACQCCHLHYFISLPVEINTTTEYPKAYEIFEESLIGIRLFDFLKPPQA